MKTSKGFQQSFNAQVAVDGKSQLIVATKVTDCSADTEELIPMVELAMANTEQPVDRVLADAGYRSEENFVALENAGIDGYVPIGRQDKSAPTGKDDLLATERMQSKLRTKRGRARYRKRKHLVESPFGWVKNVLGFRDFSLRGLRKVQGEWNLVCLALNLRRMRGLQT